MAAQQERWFFSKNQYTKLVSDLGGAVSRDGYYNVEIKVTGEAPFTSYTLEATPVSTKSQSKDSECTKFTIDSHQVVRIITIPQRLKSLHA